MGIQQMLLASGPGFIASGAMASLDIAVAPAVADAEIEVNTAGFVTASPGTDFQMVKQGNPALLEIFVTGTGDTPDGSAIDTWLALTSTRTWSFNTGGGVANLALNGTYSVRVAASGQVIGGGSFNLTAIAS
jgi:hypothetical protein